MFEIYKKNSYVVFNLSEVIMTIIINYDLIIFQDNEYSNQGIKIRLYCGWVCTEINWTKHLKTRINYGRNSWSECYIITVISLNRSNIWTVKAHGWPVDEGFPLAGVSGDFSCLEHHVILWYKRSPNWLVTNWRNTGEAFSDLRLARVDLTNSTDLVLTSRTRHWTFRTRSLIRTLTSFLVGEVFVSLIPCTPWSIFSSFS